MVFNQVKFKHQFPLCKHLYLPDPNACSGAGALCFADPDSQASLPELLRASMGTHTAPSKSPNVAIHNYYFPFHLAEKETNRL